MLDEGLGIRSHVTQAALCKRLTWLCLCSAAQELRTPTLPASLANSPDGAAFAAFFGGPSLGSLKAPSLQGSVHTPQPHPAPPSRQHAMAEATRQQQQAMQLLQQQQAALKQGQDALRQEQLNLQVHSHAAACPSRARHSSGSCQGAQCSCWGCSIREVSREAYQHMSESP